MNVIGVRR
jgi:hypothetical protein